jgi:hypothetical protein
MHNSESRRDVTAEGSSRPDNGPLANEALALMLNTEKFVAKAAAANAGHNGILEFPSVGSTSDGKPAYSSWASEIVFGHQYTARPGDDLHSVAKRSLGVTGHPSATESEIRREMARIQDLNKDQLPHHYRSHEKLPAWICLKLQDDQPKAPSVAAEYAAPPKVAEQLRAPSVAADYAPPPAPAQVEAAGAAPIKPLDLSLRPLRRDAGSFKSDAVREQPLQWGDAPREKQ